MKNDTIADRQAAAPVIHRHIAFPLAAFDHLKATQRQILRATGQRLNNSQALACIVLEHQRDHQTSTSAQQ